MSCISNISPVNSFIVATFSFISFTTPVLFTMPFIVTTFPGSIILVNWNASYSSPTVLITSIKLSTD